MKEYDVISLGELLIDFTMNGKSQQNNDLFEANPGGAPCNVLSILNNLGKKTAFIGKVGKDQFGLLLKNTLEEIGIETKNLVLDPETNTTLAFVHTAKDGDRSFSFYRKPGADMMLKDVEINEELIKKGKLFHFGSLSMTHSEVKKATQRAIHIAKENKLLISFDPNLRPPLWNSLEDAKKEIKYGLSQCDILKIADNEIQFITGLKDYDAGINMLIKEYDIPLILLTLGKDGSRAYCKGMVVEKPGFVQNKVVDTTGAGDTFCGCVLNYILEHGMDSLTEKELEEMLVFANAGASLITTKKGALRVMPTKDEIERLIGNKN